MNTISQRPGFAAARRSSIDPDPRPAGGVFLLVYRLVESIYLLCLAVSRLKGV